MESLSSAMWVERDKAEGHHGIHLLKRPESRTQSRCFGCVAWKKSRVTRALWRGNSALWLRRSSRSAVGMPDGKQLSLNAWITLDNIITTAGSISLQALNAYCVELDVIFSLSQTRVKHNHSFFSPLLLLSVSSQHFYAIVFIHITLFS